MTVCPTSTTFNRFCVFCSILSASLYLSLLGSFSLLGDIILPLAKLALDSMSLAFVACAVLSLHVFGKIGHFMKPQTTGRTNFLSMSHDCVLLKISSIEKLQFTHTTIEDSLLLDLHVQVLIRLVQQVPFTIFLFVIFSHFFECFVHILLLARLANAELGVELLGLRVELLQIFFIGDLALKFPKVQTLQATTRRSTIERLVRSPVNATMVPVNINSNQFQMILYPHTHTHTASLYLPLISGYGGA